MVRVTHESDFVGGIGTQVVQFVNQVVGTACTVLDGWVSGRVCIWRAL